MNLNEGETYGFQVQAFNFNGGGTLSPEATFKACTAPTGLSVPTVTATTKSTISFVWTPPTNDGACPVSSYDLVMDDGAGGAFANRDEAEIGNKHYLRSHTVTFASSEESKLFRFRMRATNEIGSLESSISN